MLDVPEWVPVYGKVKNFSTGSHRVGTSLNKMHWLEYSLDDTLASKLKCHLDGTAALYLKYRPAKQA